MQKVYIHYWIWMKNDGPSKSIFCELFKMHYPLQPRFHIHYFIHIYFLFGRVKWRLCPMYTPLFGEFCLAKVKVIGYSLTRANTSMAYLNRLKPNFIAVNCLRIKIPIMPGTYFYCVFMRQRYSFCDNFGKFS